MTDPVIDIRSFRVTLLKRPGLSVARLLAHGERARRNCEDIERQKQQACTGPVDDGSVRVQMRIVGYIHDFPISLGPKL